jgi:hypothetical protein
MIEKQTFEAARREAERPTQIPDGTLREVKRYDQSGRVSYEFFGKVGTWLNDFHPGSKKVIGIRQQTERGYRPSNVG